MLHFIQKVKKTGEGLNVREDPYLESSNTPPVFLGRFFKLQGNGRSERS
jgi:hypothetical protein